MKNWLHLMQLTDSNLPSGAFSHSFGLETFIQKGLVTNVTQFELFLRGYIQQLCFTDGLASRLIYDAIVNNDFDAIKEVDHLLYCSTSAKESRLGAQRIGQQLLKLYGELYNSKELGQYRQLVLNKECYGHPSIAQTLALYHLQIEQDFAVQTVLYTACTSLIQNAVRGIPLGQTDGQRMLQLAVLQCEEALETIIKLPKDVLGATMPNLELHQMLHEQLHVRLFMS